MSRKVVIVAHHGRPEAVAVLSDAVEELRSAGFEVAVHDDDLSASFDEDAQHLAARERVQDAELVMVLGGDGTILRAAELTHGTSVPLLGVNLGHVGFLAESDRADLRPTVERVAAGEYEVEQRNVLDVEVLLPGARTPLVGWALNEATLEKSDPSRMVDVAIQVDGRPVSVFGCDGMVLSTATGSTAHAFSAGGPVIWPDVDAVLVVPLAAYALFSRPMVISPSSQICLEVLGSSSSPGVLTCDGRRKVDLPRGSRVTVRGGASPVRLARLSRAPFADRLVDKFALPVTGFRQSVERRDADRAGGAAGRGRSDHDEEA